MPVSAVPTCLEQAGIVELLDQQIPQSLCVCRNGFEQQVEAGDMSFGSQVAEQSHDRLWVAARDFRESGAHDVEKIRSEEHTSELQSLMRTSYAVFCLKKKIEHNLPVTNALTPKL